MAVSRVLFALRGSGGEKMIETTMTQTKANQVKDNKANQVKDKRTRILLVDDHAVVRYGIAQLINREGDLVVCSARTA